MSSVGNASSTGSAKPLSQRSFLSKEVENSRPMTVKIVGCPPIEVKLHEELDNCTIGACVLNAIALQRGAPSLYDWQDRIVPAIEILDYNEQKRTLVVTISESTLKNCPCRCGGAVRIDQLTELPDGEFRVFVTGCHEDVVVEWETGHSRFPCHYFVGALKKNGFSAPTMQQLGEIEKLINLILYCEQCKMIYFQLNGNIPLPLEPAHAA